MCIYTYVNYISVAYTAFSLSLSLFISFSTYIGEHFYVVVGVFDIGGTPGPRENPSPV